MNERTVEEYEFEAAHTVKVFLDSCEFVEINPFGMIEEMIEDKVSAGEDIDRLMDKVSELMVEVEKEME